MLRRANRIKIKSWNWVSSEQEKKCLRRFFSLSFTRLNVLFKRSMTHKLKWRVREAHLVLLHSMTGFYIVCGRRQTTEEGALQGREKERERAAPDGIPKMLVEKEPLNKRQEMSCVAHALRHMCVYLFVVRGADEEKEKSAKQFHSFNRNTHF